MGTCTSSFGKHRKVADEDTFFSEGFYSKKSDQEISKLFIDCAYGELSDMDVLTSLLSNSLIVDSMAAFLFSISSDGSVKGNSPKKISDIKEEIKNFGTRLDDPARDGIQKNCRRYLNSLYYERFRQEELNEILSLRKKLLLKETTIPDLDEELSLNSLPIAEASNVKEEEVKVLFYDTKKYFPLEVVSFERRCSLARECFPNESTARLALESCDQLRIVEIARKFPWLLNFIVVSETLPFGVTVSCAGPRSHGYPLVYANKHFEKMCGRSREFCVGYPGTFLQTHCTLHRPGQALVMDDIEDAIKNGFPVVEGLLCSGSNGVQFSNTIGVKPIIGSRGTVEFFVTIQIKTSPRIMSQFHVRNTVRSLLSTLSD